MGEPDKICRSCGRRIEWRKKWERDWDQVRYCSTACRRRGVTDADRELEAVIRRGVAGSGSLALDGIEAPDREAVRRAARRLTAAGEVEMLVRGRVVDPSHAKGPVEVRRVR